MMRSEMMKSNFAQTCNKFSQFLKGRRSLVDLVAFQSHSSPHFEPNGANEMNGLMNTSMSLYENEGNGSRGQMNVKSLDLFPLTSSSSTVTTEDSTKNLADWSIESLGSKEEHKTIRASMTIFYGGKVIVFDDLPEDKAEEIMSLANKGMPISPTRSQTPQLDQGPTLHGDIGSSDWLPIARRVSLQRFMEKRKNRIAASAPYQIHHEKSDLKNYGQRQEQDLELKLF